MRATILSLGVSACRQAGQWLDWGERALEDPISLDLVVGLGRFEPYDLGSSGRFEGVRTRFFWSCVWQGCWGLFG